MLEIALKGNDELEKHLDVIVPDNWSEFGDAVLTYVHEKLSKNPTEEGWWTYFPVHKENNTLIGSGGYKGAPDEDGVVEIGYEITEAYRNQGLATEFAKALIEHAFTFKEVKKITAHTLGEINPSSKLLITCGFTKTHEINDMEDGLLWKWELDKP